MSRTSSRSLNLPSSVRKMMPCLTYLWERMSTLRVSEDADAEILSARCVVCWGESVRLLYLHASTIASATSVRQKKEDARKAGETCQNQTEPNQYIYVYIYTHIINGNFMYINVIYLYISAGPCFSRGVRLREIVSLMTSCYPQVLQ